METEWELALRSTAQRDAYPRVHYVSRDTGQTACEIFNDRFGWIYLGLWFPPGAKICMLCEMAVDTTG